MQQPTGIRPKIGGWPLTVALLAVLVFLFFIRHILLPFILAAALAFVLTPPIDWVQRKVRLRRWVVAALAYVLVLAILALLAILLAGPVMRDVSEIAANLPQTVQRLISELIRLAGPSLARSIDVNAINRAIDARLQTALSTGSALTLALYGFEGVFGAVLALFALAYFLISGKRIAAGIFWLVPPEYRLEVSDLSDRIIPVLWRYFVGLLVVVSYTITMAWLVFGPGFHLPQAPLLGVLVGILELIPIIGPTLTLCIVGIAAAQQTSVLGMLVLFGFAIGLRISIDQLVGPLVLGKAARLHPFVIIFAFLSGGVLFGVIGLILAVPVAASIKVILSEYYAEPVIEQASSGRSGANDRGDASFRSQRW